MGHMPPGVGHVRGDVCIERYTKLFQTIKLQVSDPTVEVVIADEGVPRKKGPVPLPKSHLSASMSKATLCDVLCGVCFPLGKCKPFRMELTLAGGQRPSELCPGRCCPHRGLLGGIRGADMPHGTERAHTWAGTKGRKHKGSRSLARCPQGSVSPKHTGWRSRVLTCPLLSAPSLGQRGGSGTDVEAWARSALSAAACPSLSATARCLVTVMWPFPPSGVDASRGQLCWPHGGLVLVRALAPVPPPETSVQPLPTVHGCGRSASLSEDACMLSLQRRV